LHREYTLNLAIYAYSILYWGFGLHFVVHWMKTSRLGLREDRNRRELVEVAPAIRERLPGNTHRGSPDSRPYHPAGSGALRFSKATKSGFRLKMEERVSGRFVEPFLIISLYGLLQYVLRGGFSESRFRREFFNGNLFLNPQSEIM